MAFSEPMSGGTQACGEDRVTDADRKLLWPIRGVHLGLAPRLALYTAILGMVVAGALTWSMYRGSVDALVDGERHELAATNEAAGLRFNARLEVVREDARVLAQLPPGVDAAGAAEGTAAGPLAATLRAILAARTDYLQVRYVGADGQEIVRAQRGADGTITSAAPGELTNLSDRAYFREALQVPEGESYVSGFDLNRVGGRLEEPYRPMVRVAAPAYGIGGSVAGVVVINVDLDRLLRGASEAGHQDSIHFIANAAGDYLYHPNREKTFGFFRGRRILIQDDLPQLAPLFAGGQARFSGIVSMGAEQYVADARPLYFDPRQPERYLVMVTLWPRSHVAAAIAALWNRTLLIAGLLLLVGVAAVAVLANRLVHPLRMLTEATSRIAAGEREVDVEIAARRRDEVGELARSFSVMTAEIRRREAEISRSAAERARAAELAQFAYIASHDLQEPLRMIDSYLGLLVRRYGDRFDGDAHEFVSYAVDGARRMKGLINDLLEYSRVTNRELDLVEVDTAAVVANVLRVLAEPIAEAGIAVSVAPLPVVPADPGQMERLFINLVENAVKYRGAIQPQISIAAARRRADWEFSVADNGIGIEPEFSEKVFEIFKRLHSREKYPGTGIGLASCRRIVERHGGRIWVDPTPGGGSTFRFTLPAGRAEGETADG